MMYFAYMAQRCGNPSCDGEKILKDVVKQLEFCVISNDDAMDAMESYLHDLVRVVNRNKRGAKINFSRGAVADLTVLEAFYDNEDKSRVFCIWLAPVKETCLSMDVERIIDEAVHKSNLSIFSQYIEQKRGGEQ